MRSLTATVFHAKLLIIDFLKVNGGGSTRRKIEPYVLSRINVKVRQDGAIVHETQTEHHVAFIRAYKALEKEGAITITRPQGVPHPMTSFETVFTLNSKEA